VPISQQCAQLHAFHRMYSSTRVAQSFLRSPLTVTLADMIKLVTDTDLVDVFACVRCWSSSLTQLDLRPKFTALQDPAAELATRTWVAVVTTPAL
jgi:hypothetical protein